MFEPLISNSDTLMNILCSSYLEHISQGFIGHLHKKIIAKLPLIAKHLLDFAVIAVLEGDSSSESTLTLEINKNNGLALLWNMPPE